MKNLTKIKTSRYGTVLATMFLLFITVASKANHLIVKEAGNGYIPNDYSSLFFGDMNKTGTTGYYLTPKATDYPYITGTITLGNGEKTALETVNSVPAGATAVNYTWPGVTNITITSTPGPSQSGLYYYSGYFWIDISSSNTNCQVELQGTYNGSTVTATYYFNEN